jgi:hypothetical protein
VRETAREKEEAKRKAAKDKSIYRLFVLAERDHLTEDLAENKSGMKGGAKGSPITTLSP